MSVCKINVYIIYVINRYVCTCMYNVGKLVPLVYLISLKFAPYANIFLKFIHNFDTGTLV
jgi:hypothetical protein